MVAKLSRALLLALLLLLPAVAQPVTVLVAFDSVEGHTEQLAKWVAEGARQDPEAEVRLMRVETVKLDDLLWADAILVGSPVYNAGLTPSVGKFIAEWPFDGSPLKNKVGAAFDSARGASAGEETVILGILHSMMLMEMVIVGGDNWRTAYGVSYIQDTTRDEKNLGYTHDNAMALGRRAVLAARCTEPMRANLPPYVPPKPKAP